MSIWGISAFFRRYAPVSTGQRLSVCWSAGLPKPALSRSYRSAQHWKSRGRLPRQSRRHLPPPPEDAGPVLPPSGLAAALQDNGSAVLEDLVFKSGSAELGPGPFETLVALAGFLKDDPARTVALVGHTDASGGLVGNTALSRARAASVRERLMAGYAVPAAQITAEGVGYLAPRATNQTEDGRAKNRRVEAILTSTR